MTPKTLFGPVLATTAGADAFTVPAGERWILDTISMASEAGGLATTVVVTKGAFATPANRFFEYPFEAGPRYEIEQANMVYEAGEVCHLRALANNNVVKVVGSGRKMIV